MLRSLKEMKAIHVWLLLTSLILAATASNGELLHLTDPIENHLLSAFPQQEYTELQELPPELGRSVRTLDGIVKSSPLAGIISVLVVILDVVTAIADTISAVLSTIGAILNVSWLTSAVSGVLYTLVGILQAVIGLLNFVSFVIIQGEIPLNLYYIFTNISLGNWFGVAVYVVNLVIAVVTLP